ncbi:MAG: DUF4832 domain-containing protein [Oscillospiraceae bacterium]|nr:DUF4832 domain-containing protein [Oscillospiraceae bacterium]
MKNSIKPIISLAAAVCLTAPCISPYSSQTEVINNLTVSAASTGTLKDSGISYKDCAETINNPGAGYTNSVWYVCKPGDTPVHDPKGSLVVMFVDISAFSSGANGKTDAAGNYSEGTDYDLDEAFFKGIRGTLENCRKNGCTVGMRFRYDIDGKDDPEPAGFEQVLHHIDQIHEDHFLDDYEDILMYIESGFVGKWGEQHGGKYTTPEYKAKLLGKMLEIVPDSVSVTVRTADTFYTWAGIKPDDFADYVAEEGSDAARVGMYNDGYMGSDTDLGTYLTPDREKTVKWMNTQMKHAYFGGEFSGNIDYAKKFDNYLPENCIKEMYATHLTYINSNIWPLYKEFKFESRYDIDGVDNSAYYGETVYRFIRDHLGYRFLVTGSELSTEAAQGGSAEIHFSIANTGFANVIKKQKAVVILEKNGRTIAAPVDIDSRKWESAAVTDEQLNLKLPGNTDAGSYKVYLKIYYDTTGEDTPDICVRFSNENIWSKDLGANYLGTLDVVKAENNSDDTFTVTSLSSQNSSVIKGDVNSDGTVTTADITALQRFLLADSTIHITEPSSADMNDDGSVNIIDFILLKKLLLK